MLCVLRSICLSSNPIFKWSIRCQVLIPYHSSCCLITPRQWRWCVLIHTHKHRETELCVDSKLSGKQLKRSGWRSCSSWAAARISAICHKIFSVSSPWTRETTHCSLAWLKRKQIYRKQFAWSVLLWAACRLLSLPAPSVTLSFVAWQKGFYFITFMLETSI